MFKSSLVQEFICQKFICLELSCPKVQLSKVHLLKIQISSSYLVLPKGWLKVQFNLNFSDHPTDHLFPIRAHMIIKEFFEAGWLA